MSTSRNIDSKSASRVQKQRKQVPTAEELLQGIIRGDKTALARALTLVESTKKQHQKKANYILDNSLNSGKESIRIGITGVPGVGKSTFIETFGKLLTSLGKKVAVLTIDPTSSLSKGSILGDKTRMEELVRDPNAFIRPSPSGTSLGGVARKTRESIFLCEAAGYNCILVETVGVGQSETAVHSMVDFFLLLKLAGAGDELQGIKRGIMEMADGIAINKADGENLKRAKRAQTEFNRALHLFPPKPSGWIPKVLTCSSLENTGIQEIWEMIDSFFTLVREDGFLEKTRQEQNKKWLLNTLEDRLLTDFYENPGIKKELDRLLIEVAENKISPFKAADQLLERYQKKV
ncbi:methylmalonyl Co-A mutase-associated GTPase MeaB [Poritiphilus flavus]|uniref:Methylmalonyl Co-A mutase-associated GTPase MeaB n=1 Tax=Poritiphilus flavus TaxID=2697053 RepID=A0A6L9E9P7_9FLAO|nr:methylmalonyl Co-A mutase-associated GTPase MeaB [Poritiphilus flavus]NAS11301.1 methylmalonyl Co-A mutase-associated GTPase MeaB [Poritiphilus flavus]